ncbi:MAG: helix-turn-helix domain-containing protein [Anaerolineales bacterium]
MASLSLANRPAIHPYRVYSRDEAALMLGISLSTLKRLIHSGDLAVSQPGNGRRIFITGASLLRMLNEPVPPAPGAG